MDPLHPTADQRDVVRWETAKNRGWCIAKDGREYCKRVSNLWIRFFCSRLICFSCLKHAGGSCCSCSECFPGNICTSHYFFLPQQMANNQNVWFQGLKNWRRSGRKSHAIWVAGDFSPPKMTLWWEIHFSRQTGSTEVKIVFFNVLEIHGWYIYLHLP